MSRRRMRAIPAEPASVWSGADVLLLRRDLRISQSTLAQLLNCNRCTIIAWKHAGTAPIAPGPVHRLLDILDDRPNIMGVTAPCRL
ncbi:MAG: hypothetical protein QM692_12850 [Thermomicrobiales bacterium]